MSEALPFFEGEYQLWWQLPRGLGFQLGAWMFFFSSLKFMWWCVDWGHEPRRTEHVLQVPSASTDRSHELVELMKNWARIHWHLCSRWPSANFLNARAWQSSTRKMRKKGQRKGGFFMFSWSIWIQESLLSLSWHVMFCDVGSSSCSICWNSGGSTFNRVFSLCSSSYNSYNSRSVKARTAWRVKGLGRWCRSGFQAAWGLNGVGWHGVAPCKGDSFIALGSLISGTCNFFESPKFPWA